MSRNRGFTLITLLLVVAVLALLSAILFPRICGGTSGVQPCTDQNCLILHGSGAV
jgi:prepilin-type N-terminal cleavage/methylation domain-containing protein